jgi:hypothetical protein
MLTVKEYNQPKGDKIYTIEAVDIKKPAGQMVVDRQSPLQQTPITGSISVEDNSKLSEVFNAKIQQVINELENRVQFKNNQEPVGQLPSSHNLRDGKDPNTGSFAKVLNNFENLNNTNQFQHQNNLQSGLNALQELVSGQEIVRNAMRRPDLATYGGVSDITFYWGDVGEVNNNFKKGYGISHIVNKHGVETLVNLLDVINSGNVIRFVKVNRTVVIGKGNYEAVLALTRDGNTETWLLSGWRIKEERADESREVSTTTTSTQTNPILSREDLGAALSDTKIQQLIEELNNQFQSGEREYTKPSDYQYRLLLNWLNMTNLADEVIVDEGRMKSELDRIRSVETIEGKETPLFQSQRQKISPETLEKLNSGIT